MPELYLVLLDGQRRTAGGGLAITVNDGAEHGGTLRDLAVGNDSLAPLALAEIVVLAWEPPPSERDLSDGALWLHGRQMNTGVFTHRFGRPPERGGFAGQHRVETSEGVCFTSAGGVAVLTTARGCRLWGFVTTARQFGEIRVTVDRDERTLLHVECVCLLDGWTLAPGERLDAETLLILDGDDPAELLERYADATARAMQARPLRATPTGWCSWYSLYNQTSAEAVLANVAALQEAQLPVALVQIDDGFQAATGDWLTPNARFPDGMAPLAERIRAAGFAPGLWLAPFVLHRDSATLRDHPGWAVHDRDGTIRFIDSWLGEIAALDSTHPEARAWLAHVVEAAVREWGYGYLKLDALAYAAQDDALYHAPNTTAAANLRAGLETIRAAAGDETYILGCTCAFGPAIGLVDAMRVGADTETL
jgi:alpha-galactosidase